MLPNGWKKVRLSELGTFSKGSGIKRDEANSGSIPAIRYGEIYTAHNDYIKQFQSFISENVAKEATLLKNGDLLFSCSGETKEDIGKCVAFVSNERAYAGGDIIILSPTVPCDSKYIGFLCNSSFVNKQRYSFAQGDSIVHISSESIGKIEIPFPPLNEQKKIAATLSVWDSAIEKMEKLIDAKESLLMEYGKELFGRTEQKQNENWSTIALSDVLNEHGDKSTGKEKVFSVSVHKGLVNQIEHLGRSFAAKDTSNYNRVHYGDIVYTKSPTGNFPLGIVKQSLIKEDVIVSPLYGVFTPKTFELGAILDFYFSSPINANNYLRPVAQKGAKNTINITNKKFLSAKLRLPIGVKEQKKIAQFVQTTKKEMAVLQEILENYKKQKQGLMQKLLTGQWRVK